jgi:hypothetical protein
MSTCPLSFIGGKSANSFAGWKGIESGKLSGGARESDILS